MARTKLWVMDGEEAALYSASNTYKSTLSGDSSGNLVVTVPKSLNITGNIYATANINQSGLEFFNFICNLSTASANNVYGVRSTYTLYSGSGDGLQHGAVLGHILTDNSNADNYTDRLLALYGAVYHKGTGTVTNAKAAYLIARLFSSGTITSMYGAYISLAADPAATGTVTNVIGVYIPNFDKAGSSTSVSNNTGILLQTTTGIGSVSNYAINSTGDAPCLFQGYVQAVGGFFTTGGSLTNDSSYVTLASLSTRNLSLSSSGGRILIENTGTAPEVRLSNIASGDSGWVTFYSDATTATRKGYIQWVRAASTNGTLVFDANNVGASASGCFGFQNGNVGIGTIAPSTILHVKNAGGGEVRLENSSAGDSTFLSLYSNSTRRGYIQYVNSSAQIVFDANGASSGYLFQNGAITISNLTASKVVFTDSSKTLTSTGSVGETQGGTGQTTYTLGDTIYSSASNTLSKLAGNITTAKKFLTQTGNGSISAAPSWFDLFGTANTWTANQTLSVSSVASWTITNATATGTLQINSSNQYVLGPTSAHSLLFITNNSTFMSANSSGTINLPNFTSGSILFIDSSKNLAQHNSNLFWDDTNNILTATKLKITTQVSFFGASLVGQAGPYNQIYSSFSYVHNNPTATSISTTSTQTTPWGYASQAQADAIPDAINKLIVDVANAKQVLNRVIDDLLTFGLFTF